MNHLEKDRKVIQVKTQELQGQRNQFSKNIGIEKGKGNDASGFDDTSKYYC